MPVLDGSARPADLARVLGALSLAGAALGLVALVLPLPAATHRHDMVVLALVVGAFGTVLLAGAERLSPWVVQGALALSTVAVSADIALSPHSAVNDEMFYLLPAVCALLFCRGRAAAVQLALIPVGYGVGLAVSGDPVGVTRWVLCIGVLAAVCVAVRALSRRVERHAAELATSQERFRTAFEQAPTGMTIGHFDGTWIRVNRAFAEFLGYDDPATLRGRSVHDVGHPDDLERMDALLARMAVGEIQSYEAERRYLRRDGTVVWGLLSGSVVRDAAGTPVHYIAHVQDLSERKAAEAELAYRAGHDPLTSLPNRTLLLDRLEGALARLHRAGGEVSVLFLDLDRFKLVNDTFGHQAGDRVVQAAAARLRALLRPDDTLARLGGDEFTILCESPEPGTAERVADRIIAALGEPFEVAGRPVFLSASIGIARTTDPHRDPALLLAEADAAMYQAKSLGGSRHAVSTPGLRLRGAEQLEIEAGLRRALAEDELELHYQPEVDLASGQITGLEALVRWRHPQRGLLLPGHFIGPAEESGLIVPLGAWVLRQACADARRWRDAGHPIRMGVNISARQLADPSLLDTIGEALAAAGLPPAALQLEITETALMEDGGVAVLRRLAALGISMAIDDFGIGFSSLGRFRSLDPVEVVKIDRSFIAGLGRSEQDTAIVGGIAGIARSLGLVTVAEGIERPDQAAQVRDLGCDLGQGFHFARPAPAGAVDALLAAALQGELAA